MTKWAEDSEIGTPHAHYAGPREGPFRCGNCVHYKGQNSSEGPCEHPDVRKDAANGHLRSDRNGDGIVDAAGCCSYYRKQR